MGKTVGHGIQINTCYERALRVIRMLNLEIILIAQKF